MRADRIAHCDEVFHKADLHRRIVDEHAAVPAKHLFLLQERRGQACGRPFVAALVALGDRHGQCQVRRAEAHSDHVIDRGAGATATVVPRRATVIPHRATPHSFTMMSRSRAASSGTADNRMPGSSATAARKCS